MSTAHGKKLLLGVITIAIVVVFATTSFAVPPRPQLLEQIKEGTVKAPYFLSHLAELHKKGICTPDRIRNTNENALKTTPNGSPAYTGPFKVLALLVTFSDHPSQVSATYFDSLLFDSVGNTVNDYYDEISFGQIDMVTVNLPSSIGWQTAPQTYAYYVNGQNGTGAYPQNTQKLCEDLVDQVDGVVDFSQYDNDGDGYVDVLVIIHAGTGAEYSGSNNDIWSHKWGINPRLKDGVYISSYTIQPEFWATPGDMTIGVYAHELGHGFGLPDLYDIDGSSYGIGKWGIMAYGSWLGPKGLGGSPAHMSAWSRIQCGFATPTVISSNTLSQPINQIETSGEIYRLWSSGSIGDEYFLVVNRQKTGYDAYLPGSGLLIWHIDEGKASSNNTDNTQEWWPGQVDANHYRVAIEQADGLWELEHKLDNGDANDPFPGGTNTTTFDATTTPSSDSYTSGTSFVKVDNISPSGSVMYADLIVSLSADINDDLDRTLLPMSVELEQNYPNPFNPSTQISFTTTTAVDLRLEIYNVLGQKVRSLIDGTVSPGTHTVTWDGKDDGNDEVAAGIYLYKLTTDDIIDTKKMILVR